MKAIKIFVILYLIGFSSHAQVVKNVLWIGNSYTGSNNLASMTQQAAQSTGDDIVYQTRTPGGYRFMNHSGDANTLALMKANQWDYVTLQAQSQEPSFPQWQVQQDVFPHAKILCDSIRAANPCAKPVFFMTWGRENGDAGNCGVWPPVCTYEGMDSILNMNYQIMGQNNKALVSPVGAVWNMIRSQHPTYQLYTSDGSHPNGRGSYAAALTFYTIFFEKDPTLVGYDHTLPSNEATDIKNIVKAVVFDSLSKWNVGGFDPVSTQEMMLCDSLQVNGIWFYSDTTFMDTVKAGSQFGCDSVITYNLTYGQDNMTTIDTTLLTGTALYVQGDTITTAGSYEYILSNVMGCDSSVTYNVNYVTSINDNIEVRKVNPNPFKDHLTIEVGGSGMVTIRLVSLDGRVQLSERRNSGIIQIETNNVATGFYVLTVEKNQSTYRSTLIKR